MEHQLLPSAEDTGRHELADTDWGTERDAVWLYGEITNMVMPVPRRDAPPRHLREDR